MDQSNETIGVILLNLGGPEQLADVEPFLYSLFSDRQIIRLGPGFLQKPIARFIASRRAPKSREAYRKIGGGSPLARITTEQGTALAALLSEEGDFKVTMAMRYWPPFAHQTLAKLGMAGIRKIVAIPLYPHYSIATTGSSVTALQKAVAIFSPAFELAALGGWPTQPSYVASLAATINEGLNNFEDAPAVQVVYSAHSLPVKFINEGDPYLEQLKETIQAVEAITGIAGRLCFQSRSGPVEWLGPSTPDTLESLAKEGCKNILMVPISFVSDHVETLYEIDMLYRDQAHDLGMRLERSESLNTRADFIKSLQEMTLAVCREKGWLAKNLEGKFQIPTGSY